MSCLLDSHIAQPVSVEPLPLRTMITVEYPSTIEDDAGALLAVILRTWSLGRTERHALSRWQARNRGVVPTAVTLITPLPAPPASYLPDTSNRIKLIGQ